MFGLEANLKNSRPRLQKISLETFITVVNSTLQKIILLILRVIKKTDEKNFENLIICFDCV